MHSQARGIVVGYDGSESAGIALDWAAAEAQRTGGSLTVLHILDHVEVTPGPIGATSWPDLDDEIVGRVAVEGAARARKTAETIEITSVAEFGQVARSLIEASHSADLIVVGAHGHGELSAVILGSVPVALSAHATCPVVVVRGDASLLPGPHRPVVVGVDASPGADTALRFAAKTAADTGAQLIVVSGFHPAPLQLWTSIVTNTLDTQPDPSYLAAVRAAAETVAAEAARVARTVHPDLKISQRVLQGSTAAVITAATYQAGLAVVGSRGRGGFAGLGLGSVTHHLLQTALCPVAVVRGDI